MEEHVVYVSEVGESMEVEYTMISSNDLECLWFGERVCDGLDGGCIGCVGTRHHCRENVLDITEWNGDQQHLIGLSLGKGTQWHEAEVIEGDETNMRLLNAIHRQSLFLQLNQSSNINKAWLEQP